MAAATAESQNQPLFIRGEGGYHTYCIAALAVTTKGILLAFAEGRRDDLPAPPEGPGGTLLPGESRERKNRTIRLSYDDGETWTVGKTLEPGPAAYSDLAVLPDGTILCFYEAGNPQVAKPSPSGFLTLARFNLEWLTSGKDKGR